jgi:hypothetical protein
LAAHAHLYGRRFEVSELRLLLVDEGFPRLTKGSVPLGVTAARYEIDIDESAVKVADLCAALKALGVVQA